MPAERPAGAVAVRAAGPQDWRALRALRLEALADTPIGFLEVPEQAAAHDDGQWRERARRWTAAPDSVLLFAERDGVPLAMAGCSLDRDDPLRAWLLAVFVRPEARGQGVLDALTARVREWARRRGAQRLVLEVHEDNTPAQRAYTRLGFVATGVRTPYAPDPAREELEMAAPL